MELSAQERALLQESISIRIASAKDMLSGLNAAKDSSFSAKLKNDLAALEALAEKLQEPAEPALEQLISLQYEQGLNDLGMCAQSHLNHLGL